MSHPDGGWEGRSDTFGGWRGWETMSIQSNSDSLDAMGWERRKSREQAIDTIHLVLAFCPKCTMKGVHATWKTTCTWRNKRPCKAGNAHVDHETNQDVVLHVKSNAEHPQADARVVLLGIAHVSAESVRATRNAVRKYKPDVVLVELCKDRVQLVMDDPKEPDPTSKWYAKETRVEGFHGLEQKTMLEIAGIAPGRGVTREDIETGIKMLVATGCFDQVVPITKPADAEQMPAFYFDAQSYRATDLTCEDGFQQVNPLQCLGYRVKERSLPPLGGLEYQIDPSAAGMDESNIESCLKQMEEKALKDNMTTVQTCCSLRKELLHLASQAGLDTNRIRTDFHNLENNKPVLVHISMSETALPKAYTGMGSPADVSFALRITNERQKTDTQDPSSKKTRAVRGGGASSSTPAGLLGDALSRSYGAVQASAGEKLGVQPGAAWRAALEEAAASGVKQVHLGDRPVSITKSRMGAAIWAGTKPKLTGLAGICSAAGVAAAVAGDASPIPLGAALGGTVAVGVLGSAWLLSGPLREIAEFASQDPEEIEESVQAELRKPLDDQEMWKLDGEDALVEWEGADRTIITERDEYMAYTLYAAATGNLVASPAFVYEADSPTTGYFRYCVGDGLPEKARPGEGELGHGAPEYSPLKNVSTVLGIVGAAHVRGIVDAWPRVSSIDLDTLLAE